MPFPRMPFPRAASRALERFTVLDLTQVRSGPTCVRQLADWGARVIKIEPPAKLNSGEPLGGPRDGPDFQNLHRRAVYAIAQALLPRCPVCARNFPPNSRRNI